MIFRGFGSGGPLADGSAAAGRVSTGRSARLSRVEVRVSGLGGPGFGSLDARVRSPEGFLKILFTKFIKDPKI